jgi:hypothetical protein
VKSWSVKRKLPDARASGMLCWPGGLNRTTYRNNCQIRNPHPPCPGAVQSPSRRCWIVPVWLRGCDFTLMHSLPDQRVAHVNSTKGHKSITTCLAFHPHINIASCLPPLADLAQVPVSAYIRSSMFGCSNKYNWKYLQTRPDFQVRSSPGPVSSHNLPSFWIFGLCFIHDIPGS